MSKDIVFKLHLSFLFIILFNYLVNGTLEIQLTNKLDIAIKILAFISGLAFFIQYFKTYKKSHPYFVLYPISASLLILAFVIRGIPGGILASIILYPLNLNPVVYQKKEICIYTDDKGLMSRCCNYKVTEQQFVIFEKNLGRLENDQAIDFEALETIISVNTIEFRFPYQGIEEDDSESAIQQKTLTLPR